MSPTHRPAHLVRARPDERACLWIVVRLSAYLDNETSAAAEDRIHAHVPRCKHCARALATLAYVSAGIDGARDPRRAAAQDAGARRRFERVAAVGSRFVVRGGDVSSRGSVRRRRARRNAGTPRADRRGSRST